jgi:hypothetical protein
MKKFFAVTCLGVVGSVGLAGALQDVPTKSASLNGATVTGLGVCGFTSDDATCWNMDGNLDPGLSSRIKQDVISSNQELTLKFGHKNRFLAFETSGQVNVGFRAPYNSYGGQWNRQLPDQSSLQLLGVSNDDARDPILLDASFSGVEGPPPLRLQPKTGATATDGTNKLTIGEIRFVKPTPKPANSGPGNNLGYVNYGYNNFGYNGDPNNVSPCNWRVDVGYQGSVYQNPRFSAFGRDGAEILYVDAKGVPVSAVTYLSDQPLTPPYMQNGTSNAKLPKRHYFQALLRPSGPTVTGAFTFLSNVDPNEVKYFEVKTTTTVKKVIGPFPLAPKDAAGTR